MRADAMAILNEESHLDQVVKLVGPDALPDEQRLILETSRIIREGFLQQNALDDIDSYSTVQKQVAMLELILHFHQRARLLVQRGVLILAIQKLPIINTLIRMKTMFANDQLNVIDDIRVDLDKQMDQLEQEIA